LQLTQQCLHPVRFKILPFVYQQQIVFLGKLRTIGNIGRFDCLKYLLTGSTVCRCLRTVGRDNLRLRAIALMLSPLMR
jgi:hypothetical protein